ncbi:MAG: hypothetical protein AAB284_06415, partial [Chloroflexota bacterium]
AKSAPPEVVRAHWDDIERVAVALGAARPRTPGEYDPDLYAAAYQRVLRHRRVLIVRLTRVVRVGASEHEAPTGATELVPSPDEVASAMFEVEPLPLEEIQRRALYWYRT